MLPIRNDFLPVPSKRRSGNKIDPIRFIVAHDTGNPNSTAKNNVDYYKRTANEMSASAHIFIDDKEIVKCIPLSEKAWHVLYNVKTDNQLFGDDANDAAIGVELCYSHNGKMNNQKAYDAYVWYIAVLCDEYNLEPTKHVVAHSTLDPKRKTDPQNAFKYIKKTWEDFIKDLVEQVKKLKK